MKICVVTQQLKKTISGVGLHTNNLVSSLLKDGHEVIVIAPEDQKPDQENELRFIGVPSPVFKANQARWFPLSWNFSKAINQLAKYEKVDLIHFTDAREALFYNGKVPSAGNINDTYSAELHSMGYYRRYYSDWLVRWLYYHIVHALERFTLNRLGAVIANSHFTAQTISEQYKLRSEKLFVCYKSVNLEIYQKALAQRRKEGAHPPSILFVGTNMQRKGLPVLIKAAPRILDANEKVEFWVVGEDKVLPTMKLLCEQLNVLDRVRFLGWKSQKELIEIYARASVFVMPSYTEALGVVFLEALAAGAAVVGTAVGGIPEIIHDRVNGRLVPPDSPEDLAKAVVEILNDPFVAEAYCAEGLRTLDNFSVQKMMLCTYKIYEAICPDFRKDHSNGH